MLLFLGSCAPFGYSLYHEAAIKPSQSYSLSGIEVSEKTTFNSVPGTLVRLSLEAYVTTKSVQEDPESFSDDYLARFKFPISYQVTDVEGNSVLNENASLAWKEGGSLSKRNEDTSSTEGSLIASINFEKFIVPGNGTFNVDIEVNEDTTYQANATSLKLHLYEGMIDNTWYIVTGFVMLSIGFILAMLGFIFLLTNAAKASTQNTPDQSVAEPNQTNIDANQQAMFIQLSAFAGYLIPFGNIIVPIILWQIWKEEDPFVDKMGREAINFQLSMMLYYIICLFLMIILIGILLIFVVMIFHLTFMIIAAVQTSSGVEYRYPMILRFIKS